MNKSIFAWCLALIFFSNNLLAQAALQKVNHTLDSFHQSASDSDGLTYFSLLADNAVFIGTDAKERWSKDEFKHYAFPYFEKGQGWTYTPRNRTVEFSGNRNVAWFDELLDSEKYGECRGSGVLELTKEGWKITQYHLTFPLPNALAGEITEQIKTYKKN